jgi:DNA polymerase-3 subunit gamma/tau
MSYLVLARKYRPQTFADVVGQAPIVKTLENSLLRKRVAHAILFSGVRGVGKTTLARIMAKAINCEGDSSSPPCNSCRSCSEITKGSALDLYEIDGASNRGIQEIRELKEKLRFLPSSSAHKIIIIDEVHMLTTEAFNALLKTLEEPPEHVFFMFATTELHKIPITILSRCQRFELKRITASELTKHFQKISDSENIKIDPDALSLIVREAEGSVRDGLSLLDQMFSFGDAHISSEDVTQVLGLTDRNGLMTITRALLAEDRAGALNTLEAALDYGIDIKRFTIDLLECFRTLVLIKIGDCSELINLPQEEIDRFKDIASDFSFETIHIKLTLLMKAAEELRYTTQPRLTLETAFLKIIEAGNIVPVSALLGKIDTLLQSAPLQETESNIPNTTEKKKSQIEPIKTEASQDMPPLPPPPPEAYSQDQDFFTSPDTKPSVPKLQPVTKPLPTPVPAPDKPITGTEGVEIHPHTHDVRRDWDDFTNYVKERKIWMSQDLQRSDSAKEIGTELHLHYTDSANCALLREKDNRKLLTEFVLDFFQKDLTVRFILPDLNGNGSNGDAPESPHKQRMQLSQDPLVQMAVEIFNGQVGDIRIGPKSRK